MKKTNDTNLSVLPTRRDSILLLAASAVCMAVDTSVLAQAAAPSQAEAAQTVGHEDAAVALANAAAANPWTSHDTPAMIAAALVGLPPIPAGPYRPTWESIAANYKDPEWFRDAKFGIYMHLGIFSVPAPIVDQYMRAIAYIASARTTGSRSESASCPRSPVTTAPPRTRRTNPLSRRAIGRPPAPETGTAG